MSDYENLPQIVKDLYDADGAITNKAARTIEKLVEALKVAQAMGMPYREGKAIMEAAGWSEEDRFELPASAFVQRKVAEALESL